MKTSRLPRIVIYASGTENGGGSGLKKLIEAQIDFVLEAKIVAVVSNHPKGGVYRIAKDSHIRFVYFPKPFTADRYIEIAETYKPDFVVASGWIQLFHGLDICPGYTSRTTINIHPAPKPEFGGKGMYGLHAHEAVINAFNHGKISVSELCMHFVTEPRGLTLDELKKHYDVGPDFFRIPVPIGDYDEYIQKSMRLSQAQILQARVNRLEHAYQATITNLVVNGEIHWDGVDPHSMVVPKDYLYDTIRRRLPLLRTLDTLCL